MSSLRGEWESINKETLKIEVSDTCPVCKYPLPVDKVQKAIDKAQSDFNINKSERLENITERGKELKIRQEDLVKQNDEIEAELKKLFNLPEKLQIEIKELKATPIKEYLSAFTAQINEINEKINQVESGHEGVIKKIDDEKESIEVYIKLKQGILKNIESNETRIERIAELEKEDKKLTTEFEKVEQQLYLIELFEIDQASLLENSVNDKFKITKFKLFKDYIHGGIEPCCVSMVDGITYPSMNNEARINSGLDIINTFSKHFELQAPIWIDNAESVNELFKTESQQIRLYVGKEKKLTILK